MQTDFENDPNFLQLASDYAENKTGNGLVVILGAGLSRPHIPSWDELKKELFKEAERLLKKSDFAEKTVRPPYEQAKSVDDLWETFSLMKEAIGSQNWTNVIRQSLEIPAEIEVPKNYYRLFDLKLKGVVSLNLDDFLLRSTSKRYDHSNIPVFGKDVIERLEFLHRGDPFIYLPHGHITSESTWVLTSEDLNEITNNQLHDDFLTNTFLSNTVLFLGVTANDIGASGRLVQARKSGSVTPMHFWLASDAHINDRKWAEDANVAQILYSARDDHSEVVGAFLEKLKLWVSVEKPVTTPITGYNVPQKISESKRNLKNLYKDEDVDNIRLTLNEELKKCQNANGEVAFDQYQWFVNEYGRSIHDAFMLPSINPAGTEWFGYEITGPPLGGRTLSHVYPGLDRDKKPIVIKILDQKRHTEEMYVSAFRRGIQSQKIMSNRGVTGILDILDAYEIPPTIILRYINSQSLESLIDNRTLKFSEAVPILSKTVETIKICHEQEETVLHRDVRPSNILVQDFDWDTHRFGEVRVVDFDLSWYRGAVGQDFIRSDPETLGFQAPEQIREAAQSQRLTRDTKVDSFGIGATLAFCILCEAPPVPIVNDQWRDRLKKACSRACEDENVGPSIFEIISQSVHENPDERPSVGVILQFLNDLEFWNKGNLNACSANFLVEMLASKLSDGTYDTSPNRRGYKVNYSWGLVLTLEHLGIKGRVAISFAYFKPQAVEKSKVEMLLKRMNSDVTKLLPGELFDEPKRRNYSPGRDLEFIAETDESVLTMKWREIARELDSLVREFRL